MVCWVVDQELVVAWVQVGGVHIYIILSSILFRPVLALTLLDESRLIDAENVEDLILITHLMKHAIPSS